MRAYHRVFCGWRCHLLFLAERRLRDLPYRAPRRATGKWLTRREPERAWFYGLTLAAAFSFFLLPPKAPQEYRPVSLKSQGLESSPRVEDPAPPIASKGQGQPLAIPNMGKGRLRLVEDVTRGNPARREMALTFDGGREANVTAEILDILKAQGVRSTIFLTGDYIRHYPQMVQRMVEGGHEIGNHTDTHPHLTTYGMNGRQETLPGIDRGFLLRQLRSAEEAFFSLTGRRMAPYWRAPYGEENAEIRAWAAEAGYRHISWTRDFGRRESLDSRDWVTDQQSRIYLSAERVRDRILSYGQGRREGSNGGIVLMHLGTLRSKDRVHERLPEIIEALKGRGYRLVTISELLREGP